MVRQSLVRGLTLRTFAAALAIPVGLSVLPVPAVSAKPAVQAVSHATDERSASEAARRQGTRVEVSAKTSPTSRTFAEPNGAFTLEQSVMPERVRHGDKWVGIDTTLITRPDGSVAPKAAAADMAFSGGGGKPLATLRQGAGTVALGWRGDLPKPTLDGDTATYAEVLPGVDLRVRAKVLGFGHELVVKTPAAAANPALAKLTFDLKNTGVTVSADKDGNMRGVDPAGTTLFQAPAPRMWDTHAVQGRSAEDAPSPKSAAVGLELGEGHVSLVPDKALLSSPDTDFPVVIDPDWGAVTPERQAWSLVRKGIPGQANWNIGPRDQDETVKGVVRVGRAPDLGSNWVDRSYFRFDMNAVRGARINQARFQIYQLWKNAHSCNPADVAPMELKMSGPISDQTSWNNQPLIYDYQDAVQSVPKIGHCSPDWVGMHAINGVQKAADGSWADLTLVLKATDGDENTGNPNSWKRFESKPGFFPKLFIEYNQAPHAPVEVHTDPPLPAACAVCGGMPWINNDRILLKARIHDPQGGQLRAMWDIWNPIHTTREQWLGSGQMFGTSVELMHGHQFKWKVRGNDGALDGPTVDGPTFGVDRQGPDKKPGVSGKLYTADNAWHGGVGVSDVFTFTANGVSDVAGYRYWLTGGEQKVVNATSLGGSAQAVVTPTHDGPVALFVQSLDRAGTGSEPMEYIFYVRSGNGPLANWTLDGNAKDESLMGTRHGSVVGNVTWAPGPGGAAVKFEGNGSYISAPNTIRTDTAFSVSAWVWLDRTEDLWYTAVSQNGANQCGFCLTYTGDTKTWAISLPQAENPPQPGWDFVRSPKQAVARQWTHLAATYDHTKSEIALYVNGELAGTTRRVLNQWNASGPVRIGNEVTVGGVVGNQLEGAVDDVRLYERPLTPQDVRALVVKDDIQAAHWKFDEDKGATAVNSVQGGDSAILQGGAEFLPQAGQKGGAVKLDADNEFVTTSGPVMATDQSFAISTWLRPDVKPAGGNTMTAISARGNEISSFFLGYRDVDGGVWELHSPEKDSKDRLGDETLHSSVPAKPGEWAHVVLVYDKPAKQMRFFVNGVPAGSAPRAKGFNATGPLIFGHGKWNTIDRVNQWLGLIDDTRVYSRTLDEAEVRGIYTREAVDHGSWKFDGNLIDDSRNAKHGTAVNGPTFVPGQSIHPDPADQAMHFDGTDDYVTAATAVNTASSFSVAAWVKPDARTPTPTWATAVSQNGTHTAAFNLGYAEDRWAFAMHGPDQLNPTVAQRLFSDKLVQPGVWTHIAGVYDAVAGEMRLHVNGLLVASTSFTTKWNATGELNIGRARWTGNWIDHLPGAVDDVKLVQRVLFQDEVSQLAGRDLTLVHNLKLDETGGTAAVDSAGAKVGTVSGSAAFGPGRVGNAIRLNGPDAQITTAGVDLKTEQSFTVAAWVNLSRSSGQLTALSIDGQRTSKFRLGHVKNSQHRNGSWIFEMPEADDDANTVTMAAVSTLDNELTNWVHLTGVYDAPAKKVWLYVNGARVGDGVLNNPWAAPGGLVIGRGKLTGAPAQAWPGSVDDVRVYTGKLDQSRIDSLYKSYPALAN